MYIRRQYIYLVFSVAVIGFGIYCFNPIKLYFQNDDFTHLLLSKEGVLFQHQSFRPVCDISMIIDQYIWKTNAAGYHFINLLLHISSTILVFFTIKEVCKKFFPSIKKNSIKISWFTALLFFVYGFHSEAVFWILGRSAMLGTIFSLLFLLFFIKRNASLKTTITYCFFYVIALLTYESAWILPVFAILLIVLDPDKKLISRKQSFFHGAIVSGLFLLYLIARLNVIGEIIDVYSMANFLEFNAFVLTRNFSKLIIRGFVPYMHVSYFLMVMFVMIIILLGFFVFQSANKIKISLTVLFLFLLISLLPYLSMGIDFHGTEGERFLYFPSFIVCFIIVYTLSQYRYKVVSYLVYTFIIACHCWMLNVAAKNNRFAGDINRLIFSEINDLKGEDLYIKGLPSSQYGALVLRDGFMEALQFLDLETKVGIVTICSKRDGLQPLQQPFKVIRSEISADDLTCEGNTNAGNFTVPISKVAFDFTDDALLIKK